MKSQARADQVSSSELLGASIPFSHNDLNAWSTTEQRTPVRHYFSGNTTWVCSSAAGVLRGSFR